MKFLIAFSAVVVAVVDAVPLQHGLFKPNIISPTPIGDSNGNQMAVGPADFENSPIFIAPTSSGTFFPISLEPTVVNPSPVSGGPAVVDFPLPEETAIAVEEPTIIPTPEVEPSPIVVGEVPAGSSPLVQIIVNVNQGSVAAPSPIAVGPAIVDNINEEVFVPTPIRPPVQVIEPTFPGPINIVDNVVEPIIPPVQVIGPTFPGPINIVDNVLEPIIPPVQVVGPTFPGPSLIDSVAVGNPNIPVPAVVIPDNLN